MADNIHAGHRERLKDEFLNGAFGENTPDHKWLELLLFYCIPQKDTNPIAHDLINRFKSINGVFEASIEELTEINGISKNGAVLLKMIIPLARKCEINKSRLVANCLSTDNIGDYILSQFYGLTKERFGIALLDPMQKIITFKFLSEGDIAEVGVSIKTIAKFVLDNDAYYVVLAHNHPKSFALPSKSDIDATIKIKETLSKLNVRLLDHIIISENDYVSLNQSREYSYIFK